MLHSKTSKFANVDAHFLWVGSHLRNMEILSLRSFLANGYKVHLWVYSPIKNVPGGVNVLDATEILPETAIFLNKSGSYASFADYFRYALLSKHGGLWADIDVIALKPSSSIPKQPFLVSEVSESLRLARVAQFAISLVKGKRPFISNNVMFNPAGAENPLIDILLRVSEVFPKRSIHWQELGPKLVTSMARIYTEHGAMVMPPEFANPIGWWHCPKLLLKPGGSVPKTASFLHCFNETWRRAGVDPNAPYPPGSLMDALATRYL
jgi:hypothetical protein